MRVARFKNIFESPDFEFPICSGHTWQSYASGRDSQGRSSAFTEGPSQMETVTHRAMQSGVPGTRLLRDGVVELKQKSELAAGRRKGPEAVTEQVRN
jgi:hypothetical protein